MSNNRDFDIIVYGATGYTGRLVAEYLSQTHDPSLRWAMAGRNADKLAAVRDEIGAPSDVPLVVADAADPASLAAMAQNARCVISTVGPYTLYGTPLVAACAEAGTDYVDLCGEPLWMVDTIANFSQTAKSTGARIVHSCGFDSIPTDLGVYLLQEEAQRLHGEPAPRVRGRVRKMQGSFSGGTAASMKATMGAIFKNPALKDVILDPFALCEGFHGPTQPDDSHPKEDDLLHSWVAPFIMATINAKNIHRSNMLLGHPYGENLCYDEMILTGPGEAGKEAAEHIAKAGMGKDKDRAPGEGPTKEEREQGFFDFLMIGSWPDGRTVKLGVTGDRDPGYGSTSKMLAESARCLLENRANTAGGVWTPAAAMGTALRDRLVAHAGLTFDVEE